MGEEYEQNHSALILPISSLRFNATRSTLTLDAYVADSFEA
jgi:hypothetical protein